ncbi:MAG: hypothetical protein S4CHLAM45_07560 [Chlamydiales bacterium]|nr:hypothetical protein [Chlamydiales bacterium]MCH9620034.1 hypothetical protein [Chlamydiales bacterium]MCH9622863.1 hypothetical protein [Chlamydiales bacterium]
MTLLATPITDIEYMRPGEFSIAFLDGKMLFQFKKNHELIYTIEIPKAPPKREEKEVYYLHCKKTKSVYISYLKGDRLKSTLIYDGKEYFHTNLIDQFVKQQF